MPDLDKAGVWGLFIEKLIDKGVLDRGHDGRGHDDELIDQLGHLFDEPETAADLHKRIDELEKTVLALTTPAKEPPKSPPKSP